MRYLFILAALLLAAPLALAQAPNVRLIDVPGLDNFDDFGSAISVDGDYAAVGAIYDDDAAENAGAVYILKRTSGEWAVDSKIIAQGGANELFGRFVKLVGDRVVIGAPFTPAGGIVYVYLRSNTGSWLLEAELTAPAANRSSGARFGEFFDFDGERILVGAHGEDAEAENAGAAYVFVRNGSSWTIEQRLTPTNSGAQYGFGTFMVIEDDRAFIGSGFYDEAQQGQVIDGGAVYAFERSGSFWRETEIITPPAPTAGSLFGWESIALDGNRLAIGEYHGLREHQGIVHIYEHDGNSWGGDMPKYAVFAPDARNGDRFGSYVYLDGSTLVVGARAYWDGETTLPYGGASTRSGSVYQFTLRGDEWDFDTKFTPPRGSNIEPHAQLFGFRFDVADDGQLLIAAPWTKTNAGGTRPGAVYTAQLTTAAPLERLDLTQITGIPGLVAEAEIGMSIDIDGNRAVVGGLWRGRPEGIVYLFEHDGTSWNRVDAITESRGGPSANYGRTVVLSGEFLFVAAETGQVGGVAAGSVFVYRYDGTNWNYTQTLSAPAGDAQVSDFFGHDVATDGDHLIIGAPGDDQRSPDAGAVHFFERVGGTWLYEGKLFTSTTDGASLGWTVALNGDRALASAVFDDQASRDAGKVIAFERKGTGWEVTQAITAAHPAIREVFGNKGLALQGDHALIGASQANADSSGATYAFEHDGTRWNQVQRFTAPDALRGHDFGFRIDLEGDRALISAIQYVAQPNPDFRNPDLRPARAVTGAAYVYDRGLDGRWVPTATVTPPVGLQPGLFGHGVAFSGSQALFGAPWTDAPSDRTGALYAATLPGAPAAQIEPPSNLFVNAYPNRVELGWTDSPTAGLATYRVYRSDDGSQGTLVGLVPPGNEAFTDDTAPLTTLYTYTVTAVDSQGAESPTTARATLPEPPTDVQASGGDGTITMSWEASPTADVMGYTIFGDLDAQASANQRTVAFDGLTNGQSYTFSIESVSSNGRSNDVVFEITPQAGAVSLTPPTDLGLDAFPARVDITWTDSPATDVAVYRVYRSDDGSQGTLIGTAAPGEQRFVDRTAPGETLYTYTVTSASAGGAESAVTARLTLVAPPTGIRVVPGDGTLTVTWTPSASPEVTGYNFFSAPTQPQIGPDETSYTFTGLTNGEAYAFWFEAATPSVLSNDVRIEGTPQAGAIAPPEFPFLNAFADGVDVGWSASASGDVTGYEVWRSDDGAASHVLAGTVAAPQTSFFDSFAPGEVLLSYYVIAIGPGGVKSARSEDVALIAPPQNVQVTAGEGSAAVSWTVANVVSYDIYWNEGATVDLDNASTQYIPTSDFELGSTAQYQITGLTNGVQYAVLIEAHVPRSISNDVERVVTPQLGILAAPTTPSLDTYSNEVYLSWNPSATASATGYRVYRSTDGSQGEAIAARGANETFYEGSDPGQNLYTYRVTTLRDQAESDASAPVSILAAPASVAAQPGDGILDVSWPASASADVVRYEIGLEGPGVSTDVQVGADTLSYRLSGLTNAVTYTVTVYAISGNSMSRGQAIQATPQSLVTLAEPQLSSPVAEAQGVALRSAFAWQAVSGAASYTLEVSKSASFASTAFRAENLTATSLTLDAAAELDATTRYYWRVIAAGPNTTGPIASETRAFLTYFPASVALSRERSFGAGTSSSDYRLISIPSAAPVSPLTTFSGRQGTDWTMYYDSGAQDGTLLQFDGTAQFSFTPGRGFWALSKGAWTVDLDAAPVAVTSAGTYDIALHSGWNVIATPFHQGAIPWSSVQAVNVGVTDMAHDFNGSYSTATTLDPYKAYYFFNRDDRPTLAIPYALQVAASKQAAASAPVFALSAVTPDGSQSRLEVTRAADALDALDAQDRIAPPAWFAPVRLVALHDGTAYGALSREARPQAGVIEVPVRVDVQEARDVRLEVSNVSALGDERIVLLDPESGWHVDLTSTGADRGHALPKTLLGRSLLLISGDASDVDARLDEALPATFEVGGAAPSPARGLTTFSVRIPASHEGEALHAELYDALGRLVLQVHDGHAQAGMTPVRIDAGALGSGTYLLRVRLGGLSQTRTLVVVR